MGVLRSGQKAPDFSALDCRGERHNLNDYFGGKLILFFLPKVGAPWCTVEACNLRDNFSRFQENRISLLGVSGDTPALQHKFIKEYDLPFPLIPDESKTILHKYKVYGVKGKGHQYTGTLRATYIINENGVIERIIGRVNPRKHAQQLLNPKSLPKITSFL